jgi:hypothetical protein
LAEPKPADQPGLPHDLYAAAIPADNPLAPDKITLGKELFFEIRLLADNSTSRATG